MNLSSNIISLTENFDVRKIRIQTPEEGRRKMKRSSLKMFSRPQKKFQPRKKFSALFDAENYAEFF